MITVRSIVSVHRRIMLIRASGSSYEMTGMSIKFSRRRVLRIITYMMNVDIFDVRYAYASYVLKYTAYVKLTIFKEHCDKVYEPT